MFDYIYYGSCWRFLFALFRSYFFHRLTVNTFASNIFRKSYSEPDPAKLGLARGNEHANVCSVLQYGECYLALREVLALQNSGTYIIVDQHCLWLKSVTKRKTIFKITSRARFGKIYDLEILRAHRDCFFSLLFDLIRNKAVCVCVCVCDLFIQPPKYELKGIYSFKCINNAGLLFISLETHYNNN